MKAARVSKPPHGRLALVLHCRLAGWHMLYCFRTGRVYMAWEQPILIQFCQIHSL